MANVISSVIVFEGPADDVTALLSRAARPLAPRFPKLDEEPNWRILFNLYPIPADVPDVHEDGVAWPDKGWMQNHWGTERLLGGGELRRETPTRGRIELLTAYEHPVGWVDKVAADHRSLTFRHYGEVELMDEDYFAVYRRGRRVRQWQRGRGRLSREEQLELFTRTDVLGRVVEAANALIRKRPTPDVLIRRAEAVGRILEKWPESAAEEGYRPEQRLEDLNRAVELDPTPVALVARGRHHQETGASDAARADFDAAVRLDPADPDALVARAEWHIGRKDSRRALIDANRAVRLHPDHPAGYERCVQAHIHRDNLSAAVRVADRWLRIDPGNYLGYYWRAVAHFNACRHELALRDLEEANRWRWHTLDWLPGWNRLRADCLFSLGRHKEAITACEEGLRWRTIEPDDAADLHLIRGRALDALRQWKKAIAAFNRALRLRSGDLAARQFRLLARVHTDDYEAGAKEFARDSGMSEAELFALLKKGRNKRKS